MNQHRRRRRDDAQRQPSQNEHGAIFRGSKPNGTSSTSSPPVRCYPSTVDCGLGKLRHTTRHNTTQQLGDRLPKPGSVLTFAMRLNHPRVENALGQAPAQVLSGGRTRCTQHWHTPTWTTTSLRQYVRSRSGQSSNTYFDLINTGFARARHDDGKVVVGWLGGASTTLHRTHHVTHVGSRDTSVSFLFSIAIFL